MRPSPAEICDGRALGGRTSGPPALPANEAASSGAATEGEAAGGARGGAPDMGAPPALRAASRRRERTLHADCHSEPANGGKSPRALLLLLPRELPEPEVLHSIRPPTHRSTVLLRLQPRMQDK
eukprot:253321-Alexandrium_andersonii.AAC.1